MNNDESSSADRNCTSIVASFTCHVTVATLTGHLLLSKIESFIENVSPYIGSFSCKSNKFSYERFYMKIRHKVT